MQQSFSTPWAAVVTNNNQLAAKVRLMKNFGFCGYDNVIYIGTNGKMNEICAVMGLTSLESLEQFIAVNYRNYQAYRQELQAIRGVRLLEYDESKRNNYQYIVLEIDESKAGVSRDRLVHILQAENVIPRRYFYPGCHRMEPYKSYFPNADILLQNAIQIASRVICLPPAILLIDKRSPRSARSLEWLWKTSAQLRGDSSLV